MRFGMATFFLFLGWPGWAQTQRNIRFSNDKQVLAGTLTLPLGTGLHPAVIIVLGSGATNRDGEVEGLKPFQTMATQLAKKGFVVLRYDNRSRGESPGKAIQESTTTELAADAQAAYRFLKGQNQVNSQRIGLIGHSEGATIAAIAAAKIPQISGLLALNGPALAGYEDILLATEQRLRQAGTSADSIQSYLANMRLYLGRPVSTPLQRRKAAARSLVRFEMSRLPADQRAKLTKSDLESAVNSQMHQVLTRWQQQYLSLNPAVVYQTLSCPVGLIFSESELEGPLSKRLAVFRAALKVSRQAHPIRLIKQVDHNLITTGHGTPVVSSAFVNAVVEEASKLI